MYEFLVIGVGKVYYDSIHAVEVDYPTHDIFSDDSCIIKSASAELVKAFEDMRNRAVSEMKDRLIKVAEETPAGGDYVDDDEGGSYWASDAEATLSSALRRMKEVK